MVGVEDKWVGCVGRGSSLLGDVFKDCFGLEGSETSKDSVLG